MSTNSTIAIRRTDGTKTGIYCHWDGYIEYNGVILQQYYNTEEKIEKLLALGDCSSIGEKILPPEENSFDNMEINRNACVPYTLRGEEFRQSDSPKEYYCLFDADLGIWFVTDAEDLTIKTAQAQKALQVYRDDHLRKDRQRALLDAILEDLDEKWWKDWEEDGVTAESLIAAAKEARDIALQRKADEYDAYYYD